jgi:hypothetical protein
MSDVANRAIAHLATQGITQDKLSVMMDLEYVDAIIPLDFDRLLAFDEGNFGHDINGIYQNFNRATKEMENCFCPRSAKPEPTVMEYVARVTLVHIETNDNVTGEFRGKGRYDVVRQAFAELTPMDQYDDDQEYKVLDVFAHTETVDA